jgi:MotA/MotB-like proton-channel complex protein
MDATNDTIEPALGNADGATGGAGGEASLTQAVRWRSPVVSAPPPASQPRNPSLPTFVGLIILILTFFIVLTSISMKDRSKSDAAIASLQEAFSGSAVAIQETDEAKDEEVARTFIAGLTNRLQSLVPMMGGKAAPASDHQILWLPIDLAFPAATSVPAPLFSTVLREVVKSLAEVPERLTPHIEMRLCASEPSDQLRARAVAIGGALSAAGAPLGQFSIGVASCNPARIGIAVALQPAEAVAGAEGQAP